MHAARPLAAAFLLALAACGTPRVATTGVFVPTVPVCKFETSAFVNAEVIRSDGTRAAYAEVLEIVVPWSDPDPLAQPPRRPEGPGAEVYSGSLPAGTVIARKAADARGAAGLVFPVGLTACVYAYTADSAGAGEPWLGSIITRPENVYGYEVRLLPAVPVRGDVVDRDGRPAARATVRVALRTADGERVVVLMTTCGNDGAFRLPPVPVGERGWSDAVAFRADAADGASARREVTPAELRSGPLRLVLAR